MDRTREDEEVSLDILEDDDDLTTLFSLLVVGDDADVNVSCVVLAEIDMLSFQSCREPSVFRPVSNTCEHQHRSSSIPT